MPEQDPAYALPTAGISRSGAGVIHRDIPLVTVSTSWGVAEVRSALVQLQTGVLDGAAQLVDAIFGDDRVQATMGLARLA